MPIITGAWMQDEQFKKPTEAELIQLTGCKLWNHILQNVIGIIHGARGINTNALLVYYGPRYFSHTSVTVHVNHIQGLSTTLQDSVLVRLKGVAGSFSGTL